MKTRIAVILAVALALAACSRTGQNDTSINGEVKKSVADMPGFIEVATVNGIVTLSGTVPDAQAKLRAGEMANRVQGVRGVVNNLHPTMAGDVPIAPPPANPALPPPAVE